MILTVDTHKTMLVDILKDIYSDTSLGPLLGFKGGSAAYLFCDLDRFSVDLDFDLLDKEKEEQVLKKIEKIAKKYGDIKDITNKRYTLFFLLSYSEEDRNIKIEISKRNFNSEYENKSYLGIPMLVMKKEDMFANKLVAMTNRATAVSRDIYDVHFFLKNYWDINKEIVEERTNMDFKDYLKKCIKFLEDYPNNMILDGIGELINEKQKKWARKNLIKDTIFQLKLKLDTLEK